MCGCLLEYDDQERSGCDDAWTHPKRPRRKLHQGVLSGPVDLGHVVTPVHEHYCPRLTLRSHGTCLWISPVKGVDDRRLRPEQGVSFSFRWVTQPRVSCCCSRCLSQQSARSGTYEKAKFCTSSIRNPAPAQEWCEQLTM